MQLMHRVGYGTQIIMGHHLLQLQKMLLLKIWEILQLIGKMEQFGLEQEKVTLHVLPMPE